MGINAATLGFLKYCAKKVPFSDTVTLGRQGYYVSKKDRSYLESLDLTEASRLDEDYCEFALKRFFGATSVDSIDNSPFEGATHLFDLNEVHDFDRQYMTVMDIGTTEHALNALNAFLNMQKLCRVGGQVIHVAPANNFCGHGFWQFSPELFFNLYSAENGFHDLEVFLCQTIHPRYWFEVKPPSGKQRAEALCSKRLYLLVRAQKYEERQMKYTHQTDYSSRWEEHDSESTQNLTGPKRTSRGVAKSSRVYRAIYPYYWLIFRPIIRLARRLKQRFSRGLNSSNPSLTKVKVADIFQ